MKKIFKIIDRKRFHVALAGDFYRTNLPRSGY